MTIDTPKNTDERGMSRRTLMKAGAWSAPVIAVAVATPLAAASADTATVSAEVGGTISASSGSASGNFTTSGIVISNVTGTWATGALTAQYVLSGPWNTGVLTKPDGSAFVLNENITYGGTVWTVVHIEADGTGTYEVHFTGQSVTVSSNTVVSIPPAIYSGTYTPGVPTSRNPIGGTVRVAAANVNNGLTVSNSSNFP